MDHSTLKKEVAAVLLDVPNHTLPLFKFRDMFEKRYRRSVSSFELYRMRDVVFISDTSNAMGLGGRTISLSLNWDTKVDHGLDVFCRMHPPAHSNLQSNRTGWAEKEVGVSLPNVEIEFRVFCQNVAAILASHDGEFPLFSFLDCYAAGFGPIQRVDEGNGVPVEHLIASVHGVEISHTDNGMKKVQWKLKEFDCGPLHIPLGPQTAQLARELVDLLKTFPRCSIPFSKLIPAYHHHFGRQCRVADYGHISLSALLQTLPMTIQVIGEGPSRIITLAHRAQMKRFAADVLRVLKAQPGIKKQIRLDEFPNAHSKIFPSRTFHPEDYGLCYFSDLVSELVNNFSMVTLVVDDDGKEMLAIPKREQSPQEIQKTKNFATEVVELLGHSIRCEMQFSKFIPSYHHHFGRQCRVSDFGFSKLAELFDAISDTVVSENPVPGIECNPEDKILRLTPKEQIKVVGEQIRILVQKRLQKGLMTRLNELEEIFLSEYGFALRIDLCGANSLRDLVIRLVAAGVKLEGEHLAISHETKVTESCSMASPSLRIHREKPNANHSEGMGNSKVKELEKDFKKMALVGWYPPPLFSPILPPPAFRPRDTNVFNFEQPPPLSPPMLDIWRGENGTSGSPPVSPSIFWTYHPFCYPPPGSPVSPNMFIPSFSYGPWNPQQQNQPVMMMSPPCFDYDHVLQPPPL